MIFTLSHVTLPVTLRPAVPLDDEQLMQFSRENKPYKVERTKDGEITVMTPVGGIGSTHEAYVASALYQWAAEEGTGLGFISNAGFNLPDGSCLSPDAAWLSLAKWNGLTLKEQEGYPPLCPEFIIEVRSRSDARRLLETRMQLWVENGAELAWLIDPIAGNVSVYKDGTVTTLERPDFVEAIAPVMGFQLRMGRLWEPR